MKRILPALLVSTAFAAAWCAPVRAADLPVKIQVDASKPMGDLNPFWRFFGYDESNFTYMKDGQKLLTEISRLGAPQVYIRAHHLMTSGDGTPALKWSSTGMYSEDAAGNPVYNWTIIDKIFDTYVQRHLKPYVEMGFMPKDLSTKPDLYPTKDQLDPNKRVNVSAGQAYPPKDFGKWGELCHQWAAHCVQRYGADEVNQWYWEVWNEPDIGYWKGTPEEYYKLYDYAVDGVRRALPTAKVGGPDAAGNDRFVRAFIEHCLRGTNAATGKTGSPLDFVSFHAKGRATFQNGHVQTGVSNQLAVIDRDFAAIASFPELKNIPIVIGESDPDGSAATPSTEAPANGYRTGTLFSSYEAEAFARTRELAAKHGVNLLGALTWSFEFENKPYFAGYRVLATNGIDLPVFNIFSMYGKMSGTQVQTTSTGDLTEATIQKSGVRADNKPDVSALAALDGKKLTVMIWNYYDDDLGGSDAAIDLTLAGLPISSGGAKLTEYRIDQDHSNSFTAWKKMGSPQNPTPTQYSQLEAAGKLAKVGDAQNVHIDANKTTVKLNLPRQATSLFVLEWN
jgi:xylan 1,4-beta-xylosidase